MSITMSISNGNGQRKPGKWQYQCGNNGVMKIINKLKMAFNVPVSWPARRLWPGSWRVKHALALY